MADESESRLPNPVKLVFVSVIAVASIVLRVLLIFGSTIAVLSLVMWFDTSTIRPVLGHHTAVSVVFYGVCMFAWLRLVYGIVTAADSGSPYTTASDVLERIP